MTDPRSAIIKKLDAFEARRRWDEICTLCATSLATFPEDPELWRRYAHGLYNADCDEEALRAIENASHHEPTSAWSLRLRSRILVQLDRNEEALKAAEEGLRLEPNYVHSHIRVATVARLFGDLKRARKAGHEATRLAPNNAEAWLSLVATATREELHEDALGFCKKALELEPNATRPHNAMAEILKELGEREGAMDHLQRSPSTPATRPPAKSSLKCFLKMAAQTKPSTFWREPYRPDPPAIMSASPSSQNYACTTKYKQR